MIYKAIDNENNEILACNAEPGKEYRCKDCGARMHLSHRGSAAIFACYPGVEHGKSFCRHLSHQDRPPHSMRLFRKEAFFEEILTPEVQNNGAAHNHDGETGGEREQNGNENREGVQERPFTSLQQMWDEGLIYRPGITRLGDGVLSSTLVSNAASYVWHNQSINGPRVIQCRPEGFFEDGMKIYFRCIKNSRENHWDTKKVIITFDDEIWFVDIVNQLFEKAERNTGTVQWLPKVKWVLLAADWADYRKRKCYQRCTTHKRAPAVCEFCYGELIGRFINRRQLYVPMDISNQINP